MAETVKDIDKTSLLVYTIVLLISALAVAASNWGVVSPTENPHLNKFVLDIGFAGIISVFLASTIEYFTRCKHEAAADALVAKINNNLFHAIYEKYIPDEIFAEVERAVMFSGVFRRGHELNYTIENIPTSSANVPCDKHVKCLAQTRYELENISDTEIPHNVKLFLEIPIDKYLEPLCKIEEIEINDKTLSADEIESHTSKTPCQIEFSYPIKIPKGNKLSVRTSATLVKRKLDSEIWTSQLPSDGIKLTVSMPNKDIEVRAHASHSQPLVPVLDNDVTKSWELKHGIFPHQSVIFWWSPHTPLTCVHNLNGAPPALDAHS